MVQQGRRSLQQQQPQPQPGQPAQQQPPKALQYHNPEPLIKVEPDLLVDQKHKRVFAKGGDVLLPGNVKLNLPGGFELPTTGPWSYLLDIPEVRIQATLRSIAA